MTAESVKKWAPGNSYGPVLSQTDLYLLNPELEINPIFAQKDQSFHLVLNLCNGQSNDGEGRNSEFTAKEQPAVLPRVEQLYIISEHSPWCTTVRNEKGVTMADVCQAVWKDYTQNYVTDGEMGTLPARIQEQVKRAALYNQTPHWQQYGHAPTQAARCRRVDWFKDRHYFEGLKKDDRYSLTRLGFKAPNIFIMELTNY
ncbi:hypothetical protein P691DRAFT_813046 [Macrolepiota fuliginosa MF-IS2]|uniref:DUF6699 domain-containing protein n=1 Tax=Macrolepiota fuliginosa MF-IS2 TaxID=1400762 RepID=A0A9P6CA08_9AGAR|nr:hypothetical protein P691DRAFT_813046 [Macrolepiota fuliginosa MF-IS2]